MPSSDRKPKRDRLESRPASRQAGRARRADRPVQPPQYYDPSELWDAEAAEALTRLYESGEGYLHDRPEDRRRRPAPRRAQAQEEPRQEASDKDRAWLDERLTDIADRLQTSLAKINPDKAVEQLTHRLDAIEERFGEVVERVAQRSDLDGLKLIEAHVLELATHVEQTRTGLERIDALDNRVQDIARKLEEGDHLRLDALEKMLQAYIGEWRKSETRTVTALQHLEGAVNRVGDSIDSLEAHKPVPDLSLSMLTAGGGSRGGSGIDPISQVYAEAARSLEPDAMRDVLDAADYTPNTARAGRPDPEGAREEASFAEPQLEQQGPVGAETSSAFRQMQEKLRQAGLLQEDEEAEVQPADEELPPEEEPQQPQQGRFRSKMLLAGGITLFATMGYLLVDALMATSAAVRHPAGIDQAAGLSNTETNAQPGGRSSAEPTSDIGGFSALSQVDDLSGDQRDSGGTRILPPLRTARIEGIGSAMAAAFRRHEGAPETASIHSEMPTSSTIAAPGSGLAMLPMTIGPASLRQAALRGEVAAQIEVAGRYAAGQGVDRDLAQALQWYGRAAAQGSAVAQYRLGAFYERGWGASPDAERARIWYVRAAEQGNVRAMHNLAVLNVSGGRKAYAEAASWFAKAAEFGLADSQVNLAILHQNGWGVPNDVAQAYKWLVLASRGGDREAASRMSQVRAQLSPGQLEAAEADVAAWRPRTPDAAANEMSSSVTLDTTQ